MTHLWNMFNQSSTLVKTALITMVGVWLIACAATVVGITLIWESPSAAQPGRPEAGRPLITLEPTTGTANTPITVRGQNWRPDRTILIYLAAPGETTPDYAVASVISNASGEFEVSILIPAEARWETIGLATVIARETESEAATQAFFSLNSPAGQPFETPAAALDSSPTVTATVGAVEEVTPTPTATPQPGSPLAVAGANVNIRSGPGTAYPVLGLLQVGQNAEISGLSPDNAWWQIKFAGAVDGRGWVAAAYVTAQNTGNIPIVQPPALPTKPTPVIIINDWRGEYYNNPTLKGDPVLVRNDAAINFDWGTGAPVAGVGTNNFSVRWTRSLSFPAGTYRFYVRVDDGVRLWIDNNLIIDQWHDSAPATYTRDVFIGEGPHQFKMEYYEGSGTALAQLTWEWVENYTDWKGEYFNNPNLNGAPVLVRNDIAVNFSWGPGAPAAELPADNFSARWTRDVSFPAGTYRFKILVDDGARLWIDNTLVIDRWRQGEPQTYTADVNLVDGSHRLRLEYFDYRYDAQVRLDWERVDNYSDWKAEYFDNRRLQGNPVIIRNETNIDHNWGSGSPGAGLPDDNFSARWTRKITLDNGTYILRVKVDDGVRLWFDDVLVIDSWQDGNTRTLETEQPVSAGQHKLKVEYYERGGEARIHVNWDKKQATNQSPQPNPGSGYSVNEGDQITFDGSQSKDPDGTIVKYEWDFDYNGSVFNVDATGATASTRYSDGPADFTVALRVTDDQGASQIATTQVQVQNVTPTVEAGGPYTALVGNAITFAGTATDPGSTDQAGLSYNWEFGDGTEAGGPIVSHSYAQAGTYTARLSVTDKDGARGSDTVAVQITTVNQPPTANIQGPSDGVVGESLSFDGNGSTDPDGSIAVYAWNFGDGATGSGPNVAHTYNAAGSYDVTLTVTDNNGIGGSTILAVNIGEPVQENISPKTGLAAPATAR